jgi:hypothetical protein
MISKKLCAIASVTLIASSALTVNPTAAPASVSGAKVVVVLTSGTTITSTSVTDVAIVTDSGRRKSYIESYFQTSAGQIGLHIESRDQRRIEAFYQQFVSAAAGGLPVQITAYASSTYQSNGYVANLESDLVYLILG